MKLAIVGSRTFGDYGMLCKFIKDNYKIEDIDEIISGGAKGADSLGAKWANENGKKLTEFLADWKTYGRRAGFLRNHDIINSCDECAAFWDGESRGTKHDIELCKEQGKECKICRF